MASLLKGAVIVFLRLRFRLPSAQKTDSNRLFISWISKHFCYPSAQRILTAASFSPPQVEIVFYSPWACVAPRRRFVSDSIQEYNRGDRLGSTRIVCRLRTT